MDIRLIFRNRQWGVKGRRRREGKPGGWKSQAKCEGRRRGEEKPPPEVEARRGREYAEVAGLNCQEKPLNGEP
jgi:hypothetical protein